MAADPKVPPASPAEDRRPIAILTTGFDYTRAEIAARLARDGEGEIIAWDVPGDDRFPFATAGDTELMMALVNLLPAAAPVSLLPIKIDPDDPVISCQSARLHRPHTRSHRARPDVDFDSWNLGPLCKSRRALFRLAHRYPGLPRSHRDAGNPCLSPRSRPAEPGYRRHS